MKKLLRKSIVLIFVLCLTLPVFAEEGCKMLVNGRTWNYKTFYWKGDDVIDTVYHSISIDGPVEFDGRLCYKFASVSLDEAKNFFYEEDDMVYFYGINAETGHYAWSEQFNFGLKPGENSVISIDSIIVDGICRRRLILNNGDVWVEGIGSRESGILADWGDTPGTFMGSEVISVYDGDKCIFTRADFDGIATDGIGGVLAVPRNSAVYDLQGRRLNGEPRSGVYIRDGKKYVRH